MTYDLLNKFVILMCLPHIIFSIDCEEFLTEVFQKRHSGAVQYTTQEEAFLLNTGYNEAGTRVGRKEECEKIPLMKYFVAVTNFLTDAGKRYEDGHGICLPYTCNNKSIAQDQSLLQTIFVEQKWYTGNNSTMYLYNPHENMRSKTSLFYITWIILALLLFFTIFSTLKVYSLKKKAISPLPQVNTIQTKLGWIYESFDLKINFISLYQTAKEQKLNENIAIFNFLRVITSIWVIFYHAAPKYSHTFLDFIAYWDDFRNNKVFYSIFQTGDLSVEYFFVLTGFLSAYTLVPKLKRQKIGILSFLAIIKHRFVRLYPVLILGFLVWWQVVPHLFSGQLWFLNEYNVAHCDKLWWSKVLLIENLTSYWALKKYGKSCMVTTWYIPIEFQMYIAAVIALIIYAKSRRIGFALIIVLICQSLGTGIANCFKHELFFPTTKTKEFLIYFKHNPAVHWYSLFIGVLWGLLYYEYSKLKSKNIFYYYEKKPIISYLSIIIGLALNAFVLLFLVGSWSWTLYALWYPLRILFIAISITLIFMPLASNRTFYIKNFFNMRIFQILGKCSYVTYLIHDWWIDIFAFTITTFNHEFSVLGLFWFTFKVFLCCQPIAFLAHLVIEKPFIRIEGYLSKSKNATSKNQKVIEEAKTDIGLPDQKDSKQPDQNALQLTNLKSLTSAKQQSLELTQN